MGVFLPTRFVQQDPFFMSNVKVVDVGGPDPGEWLEIFIDNFEIDGGSTDLSVHTPDVAPSGVTWKADASNFVLITNSGINAVTPDEGDMAEGPIAIYDTANVDLNSDASYPLRFEIAVGMRADTGLANNLAHRIVVRGTSLVADQGGRYCWVLEYTRAVSGGAEIDSTLQFKRFENIRAADPAPESGSLVSATDIRLVGKMEKLIIEDDGTTLTAWFENAPSDVATVTPSTVTHVNEFIVGMGIGGQLASNKHFWGYFKVFYQT